MKMKSAMELAGLIRDMDDGNRVTFVGEGEACLHYCMNKQNESSQNGVQVNNHIRPYLYMD
jgi:hypothetical protein